MQIALDGISKQFGGFWALENVSLQLEPGQVVALLGPNGAGKTTLLNCLAGIVRPSQGKILYDGEVFLLRCLLTSLLPETATPFPQRWGQLRKGRTVFRREDRVSTVLRSPRTT